MMCMESFENHPALSSPVSIFDDLKDFATAASELLHENPPYGSARARLIQHYGPLGADELWNGAVLGLASGRLELKQLRTAQGSPANLARFLSPDGGLAAMVREWQNIVRAGELPPDVFIAYHLREDWGVRIDSFNLRSLANHLAAAFSPDQLSVTEAESILARRKGKKLNRSWALLLANQARDQACRNQQAQRGSTLRGSDPTCIPSLDAIFALFAPQASPGSGAGGTGPDPEELGPPEASHGA